MKLGNFQKALEYHEKALEIRIKSLGPHHVAVATTKKNIGIVHGTMGNQTTAKNYYKEAYAIYLKSLGPNHPFTKGLAPFI